MTSNRTPPTVSPIGMQILGKHFDEATVLRVAHVAEHALAKRVWARTKRSRFRFPRNTAHPRKRDRGVVPPFRTSR